VTPTRTPGDPNPERSAEIAQMFAHGPRYFGRPWGPACDDPARMIDTPIGWPCMYCGELTAAGDDGIIMVEVIDVADPGAAESDVLARLVAQHRECFLHSVLGTPACRVGTCTCATEPPERRRQHARETVAFWDAVRTLDGCL
jgi:hypothetical protein